MFESSRFHLSCFLSLVVIDRSRPTIMPLQRTEDIRVDDLQL
jgi:hypothetical protein